MKRIKKTEDRKYVIMGACKGEWWWGRAGQELGGDGRREKRKSS
jgi:hypothetical protein